MVAEMLGDRQHKITGEMLCAQLGMSDRELRRQIQLERLAGAAICAEVEEGNTNGYFIGNAEDCMRNVRNLQHKAAGLRKSWKALSETAQKLKEQAEKRI